MGKGGFQMKYIFFGTLAVGLFCMWLVRKPDDLYTPTERFFSLIVVQYILLSVLFLEGCFWYFK